MTEETPEEPGTPEPSEGPEKPEPSEGSGAAKGPEGPTAPEAPTAPEGSGAAEAPEAPGAADGDGGGLGERERAVLAVERRSWPGPGAKERAVREGLGLSPTRYYQLLNALLDDPRALAHDPVTVNRLRRVREERERRR
ncbi:DUF3263 domain-containing protein [Streptomyces sp. NPDC058757]|uniref:DUF3263 domain-containing protein n=1 Tax=Streptomyces sp. NPDC058757 TaxID=3346626 RepID=UPI0036847C1C